MYVTRPLSMYQKDPSMLSLPPPEGPNSGILVIQDQESERTSCFGLCKRRDLADLPCPQNKNLTLSKTTTTGQSTIVSYFYAALIPVLNQPLSSKCYYAISSRGSHMGEAYTSSTEEDFRTCCFCTYIRDIPPQPLNPANTRQQFEVEILKSCNGFYGFTAKAVASDVFLPKFLAQKGWLIHTSTPSDFHLDEAPGLDSALRARLPDFNTEEASNTSSQVVVVGKWYCPFMFVKEGSLTPKDQMKRTRYYEMILEQRWEEIYACESDASSENSSVVIDVTIENEFVTIVGGNGEVVHEENDVANGVMWYKGSNGVGGESKVGLSLAISERMKWEQQRFGWNGGNEKKVRLKKVEEFKGLGEWKKFICYVLVESFVLKRMDGSLVLTYGFRHINHIRTKWE